MKTTRAEGVVGIVEEEEEEEEEEDAAQQRNHINQTPRRHYYNNKYKSKEEQEEASARQAQANVIQAVFRRRERSKDCRRQKRTLQKTGGRQSYGLLGIIQQRAINIKRELAFSDVEEDEDDDGNEIGGVTG